MGDRLILAAVALTCACWLTGCATPPRVGSSEAEVVEYFGSPVETRERADGNREFDYPRGPLGRETWRVTLDRDNRVVAIEQLLDPTNLGRIKAGMTREEVHAAMGRHAITTFFQNLNEEVWSWRYTELGGTFFLFNAHFDVATGALKYTSRTPEFVNEIRVRGRR